MLIDRSDPFALEVHWDSRLMHMPGRIAIKLEVAATFCISLYLKYNYTSVFAAPFKTDSISNEKYNENPFLIQSSPTMYS